MAVRGGTASLRWSLHTVFNTHKTRCLFPSPVHLKFCSLVQPRVSGHSVDNCDEFLPWLERKAGSTVSSSLSIGNSSYGRSLFASKTIQTGDCILKVPYSVQLTVGNLPPEIRSLISEEVGNIAKLAIVILIEKKLGQGSEWDPYISCLPQQGEMHNTIFWNESELEMIHQSSVYQETIYHKSQIEKNFLAIRPVIADRDYAPGEQVLISYGKFPNATLMLDFGFTIPYNIYDQVQIQFDIPKHDPLHGMKLKLLQRYFVPPTKDMKGLKYSVNSFTINIWPSDGAVIT